MNLLGPDADAFAITGLRQVATNGVELVPSEPPSGPRDASDEGPETELPIAIGQVLAGRYAVERILAEGGMGVVCLGRHVQLHQPVAIKFLRRALAGKPAVVQRFLNEGRALAALRSEHVVRVMDVGQLDSGRPYLVMEYLEGIDLDALVDRGGALDVQTALDYALQVCEPLGEAHARGIVHRDIKPENLFLSSGGPGKAIIKVLDFGLAKQFASSKAAMTGPQDSMGSPCYMSPEQITTPQSIDARTDIWSLGVVLHRLLTDTLPFDGNSLVEVLSHVLNAAPTSLRDARPDLAFDSELEAIVARCLSKTPEGRYASIDDLAQALRLYLDHRLSSTQHASLPPAPLAEDVEFEDDGDLRIAGVRSRWPGALLVLLAVAAAAVYRADSTGRIRVRDLTDGRVTPARLSPDVLVPARIERDDHGWAIAHAVFAQEPARDASGALTLRAEPEREIEGEADEADASAPLSEAERARKEARYRDYLRSQGLTPLREVPEVVDPLP